ncbi:MAG: hypothetical protein H6622_02330 [Halobacteriovoraceae bacterium]|nr:hypothetical protein [Halobacteriovoraceae bacterium]
MSVVRNIKSRRASLKERFADPRFIIEQISELTKEGDIAASTDLISAYISNSPKYENQDEFAESIGTTRQTLYRMFAHENVSLNVFFGAIERIYDDINND